MSTMDTGRVLLADDLVAVDAVLSRTTA